MVWAKSARLPAAQVLQHWHANGHKALFFTQTQQMLDIAERAVQAAGFRQASYDTYSGVGAVSFCLVIS